MRMIIVIGGGGQGQIGGLVGKRRRQVPVGLGVLLVVGVSLGIATKLGSEFGVGLGTGIVSFLVEAGTEIRTLNDHDAEESRV